MKHSKNRYIIKKIAEEGWFGERGPGKKKVS